MYFQPYGDEQQLNLNWIINEIINLHKQLDPDYETPSFTQVYPYSNLNRLNLDWVLSELKALKELAPEPTPTIDIQAVAEALVALPFDSNTPYQMYDFISRDGEIWRATQAIAAGGDWDETKWFKTKIGTDLAVLERWINTINNSLTAEIQARQDADTTLQTNINNEALARQQADTTLQNNINGLTSANISDDSDAGGANVKLSLNALKGSLNILEGDVLPLKAIYATPAWTIGSLSTSDGSEVSATNQIRSSFIRCANGTRIGCADGYQFIVCLYDIDTGAFSGASGSWTSAEYVITAARWARIIARRVDQSTISSTSDVSGNIYVGDYEIGNSVKGGSLGQLNYCKLPDGVMIQWGLIWRLPQNPRAWGTSGLYIADFSGVTFPEQFIATPVVNISPNSSNYSLWVVTIGASATGIGNIQSARATNFESIEYVFGYTAIGRWK